MNNPDTIPHSINLSQLTSVGDTNENLIKIKARIDSRDVLCLVDTGASTEFIKKSLIVELLKDGCNFTFQKATVPVQVTLGNNTKTLCHSIVMMNVQINGSSFQMKAFILDELPFEIIFGLSFLKRYNAIIDTVNHAVSIDSDYEPKPPSLPHHVIYLEKEVHIPARCEMMISCIHNAGSEFSVGFITSYPPLTLRQNIYTGRVSSR